MSRSLSRLQALLLGAVILLGVGLGVAGLFTVGSRGWFGKDTLHVRVGFPEIRGVEVGTRVRILGMDAGEVESITPPDEGGDGLVVLRLRIRGEQRHLVRSDSVVRIVSEGMLGAKVVEVGRRSPKPGRPAAPAGPAPEDCLLASEPSAELTDVLGQVGETLKDIRAGEGTLGKLARNPEAHDALVELLRQSGATMRSIQDDAEAVKRLPLVGGYVEDPVALLVRPGFERNRRVFAEEDLFEPNRAVLTARGRQRLDDLAPWLTGLKHKGSEVVVVSYADPRTADRKTARSVTRQQAESVCTYLKEQHAVQKMGWFSSRKVTALGQGVQPPPEPERQPLPPARVEVLVFVPQG